MKLKLTDDQAEALRDFLGDQLQDQWKNMQFNLDNNYFEDAEEDKATLDSLLPIFKILNEDEGYSRFLLPWDTEV